MDGDSETGVTCHHMLEKFDVGKVLHMERIPLDGKETSKSLYEALLPVTANCFEVVMRNFFERNFYLPEGEPQEGESSYHFRKLPFDGVIQQEWGDVMVERFIRAMSFPPLEGAVYVQKDGTRKICDSFSDFETIRGT